MSRMPTPSPPPSRGSAALPPPSRGSAPPSRGGSVGGQPPASAPGSVTDFDLMLEQTIGFSGHVPGALKVCGNGKMVYAVGSWLIVSHKDDPAGQTYLRGHTKPVQCVAVSSTGRYAASGESGKDSDVIVWDLETYEIVYRLSEHDHGVRQVAFSEDEKLLLTISSIRDEGGKMIVWDMSSGMIVASTRRPEYYVSTPTQRVHHTTQRIHHTELLLPDDAILDALWAPGVGPDGAYSFVTVGKNADSQARGPEYWTLNPYTGALDHVKGETRKVNRIYTCCTFSPSGDILVCGTTNGDAVVFYNKRLQEVIPVCKGRVGSVVGPMTNGCYIAGGEDGSVVPFNPEAQLVYASGDYKTPGVADCRRIPPAAELMGSISSMALDAKNDDLVVATAHCLIYRMNMVTLDMGVLRENHMGPVNQVCFNPIVSDIFATASQDKSVMLWSGQDYSVQFKATHREAGSCWCVCMTDDLVLSGWQDGEVRAHRVPTGELVWTLANVHKGGVRQIAVSAGQHFMVTGGEMGDIRFWDLARRTLISLGHEHKPLSHQQPKQRAIDPHYLIQDSFSQSRVTQLEVFDGDEACLSSSRDGSFVVWDVRRGARMSGHHTRMGGINGVGLGRDQVQVVSIGSDQQLTFWDLRESHPVQMVPEAHAGEGTCVCVSPNGALVASGGADMVIRIWEFATGRLLNEVVGHSHDVTSVRFSFDSKTLISTALDGTMAVWKLHPAHEAVASQPAGSVRGSSAKPSPREVIAGQPAGSVHSSAKPSPRNR